MRLADAGRACLLVLLVSSVVVFLSHRCPLWRRPGEAGAPSSQALTQLAVFATARSFSQAPVLTAPPVLMAPIDDYLPSVCAQGMYHWTPKRLPVKVFISSGANVPGYRRQFDGMIRNAFNNWCAASGGKLSWQEVGDAQAADVVVGFTAQPRQRANGTEAGETNAYAKLDQSSGHGVIYGAKMSILTELAGQPFTDQFMDKTILHETGHALGLQGHSPVRTDIMYYSINDDQQASLTDRDRATMAHLYADYPDNGNIAAK